MEVQNHEYSFHKCPMLDSARNLFKVIVLLTKESTMNVHSYFMYDDEAIMDVRMKFSSSKVCMKFEYIMKRAYR